MATLSELLTEPERENLQLAYFVSQGIDITKDFIDLTTGELSIISTTLMNTEYSGKTPPYESYLCVEALSILMKRAHKLEIDLFN